MTTSILIAALAMGFFGSPHCLGMCGGIITAFGISMQNRTPAQRLLLITGYHLGRLVSYLILGLIAVWFGQELLAPFLTNNNLPRYILGGAFVFVGLMMLGLPVLTQLEKIGLGLWNRLAPVRAKVLPIDSLPKALAAGLLWGFLPCGMVYGALVMTVSLAVQANSHWVAPMFMGLFWLGTLPMLLATGSVIALLRQKIQRFNLRIFSGIIMIIAGVASALFMPIMHSIGGHDHHHGHAHHAHSDSHANHESHTHESHASHESHADHTNHNEHSHDHHKHNQSHDHSQHEHGEHTHHDHTHSTPSDQNDQHEYEHSH